MDPRVTDSPPAISKPQPAVQKKPETITKKVFGRSFRLAVPTMPCSMELLERRAGESFGRVALEKCYKADVSPLFSGQGSQHGQQLLRKAEGILTESGVNSATWSRSWQKLETLSMRLREFLQQNDDIVLSQSQDEFLAAIKKNGYLAKELTDLAVRESRQEPEAMFLAMILDARLTAYLGLASHVNPFCDWRAIHLKVVEDVWSAGKKAVQKAGQKAEASTSRGRSGSQQELLRTTIPQRPSLADVRARAQACSIPPVVYSPTKFYDGGRVLFAINSKDKAEVGKFYKQQRNYIERVETRLRKSGVTDRLFDVHWSFFCDYTDAILESKKILTSELKCWLATVAKAEIEGRDLGLVLALMLDYMTVNIQHEPEKHKGRETLRPTFDWRKSGAGSRVMTEQKLLGYFDDSALESEQESSSESEEGSSAEPEASQQMVPPAKRRRLDSPEPDLSEIEGTDEYELKRMEQLFGMWSKRMKQPCGMQRCELPIDP